MKRKHPQPDTVRRKRTNVVRHYTDKPLQVRDEETGVVVSNFQGVLDGDLDVFIEARLLK